MPLSAKQNEYLAIAFACFETEPKIDYEKFRELAGLKTANSARELMRVTKQKLKAEYFPTGDVIQAGSSKATPANTPSKPVTTKKSTAEKKSTTQKRSAAIQSPTPAKKARTEATQQAETPIVKEEPDLIDDLLGDDGYY